MNAGMNNSMIFLMLLFTAAVSILLAEFKALPLPAYRISMDFIPAELFLYYTLNTLALPHPISRLQETEPGCFRLIFAEIQGFSNMIRAGSCHQNPAQINSIHGWLYTSPFSSSLYDILPLLLSVPRTADADGSGVT